MNLREAAKAFLDLPLRVESTGSTHTLMYSKEEFFVLAQLSDAFHKDPDWRKILKAYIALIEEQEGTSFLNMTAFIEGLDDAEMKALEQLAAETIPLPSS